MEFAVLFAAHIIIGDKITHADIKTHWRFNLKGYF